MSTNDKSYQDTGISKRVSQVQESLLRYKKLLDILEDRVTSLNDILKPILKNTPISSADGESKMMEKVPLAKDIDDLNNILDHIINKLEFIESECEL